MGENREGFGEVVSGGNNLRILLVGDFSENYDEGLKNIAKYFYEHLRQRNDVKKIVTGQDTPSPRLALTYHITIPLF